METQQKLELISRGAEEILTDDDLIELIRTGQPLNVYIGFEISGKIHLGSGIVCMQKIVDLQKAGAKCTIFLADYHSWINDKFSGNLSKIVAIANGYFKEGLKAGLRCVGGDPEEVDFVLASELYRTNPDYWAKVLEVGKNTTLSRLQRSITIMGREEGEEIDGAKLIYPLMQVADVFEMNISIALSGMDQRKAYVIMRDVADKVECNKLRDSQGNKIKPVAIHVPLILGLSKDEEKMSKSSPQSAIFIHDSEEEIKLKIQETYCPEGEVRDNPILNWVKIIVFHSPDKKLTVKRTAEHGGDKTYQNYADLEKDFAEKKLHPLDLKNAVTSYLIEFLAPARQYFADKKELLQEVEAA